ncbi:Transposon Tf2-2 polyprotein [Vitis vinifera]|uniref:Transposon Tf2-2 polyprotein n=1 Tax=Vitis vinifera TaxID=29760 RepID=A0A438J3A8_VITVI|nr:Transposon Tf2-2 polyprotein [Vitis vinifera]
MCIDYRALNKVTVKNKYSIPLIADLFDQLGRARYFTKLDLSNVLHPHEQIFHPYLDKFVEVYLDDIVIYSNTLKEHKEHLRKVFKILRQNKLYVKKGKCSFAKEEVNFLGHRIRDGKLMMDDSKVKAIQEWDPPTKVPQLRYFLGMEWDGRCQQAFEDLKKAVTEEPVLALPDHTKVFEVHTDASDFAIGGVLMQERHPIAFESRKLNDAERRYTLLPDTEELSPKQARWQDFLAEFDYTLEYKPGSANHVADALSRKAELASITRKTKRFWVEDDLFYTKWRRLYVPKWGNIRRNLIKECHDTKWLGTLGNDALGHYLSWLTIGLRYRTRLRPITPMGQRHHGLHHRLPKAEDSGSIIVVVDRFSKYATFIAAPTDCTAEETARLFLKHVVKYWGLSKFIISDRDPRFTGKFWTELFKLMGSELHFSLAFTHRQMGRLRGATTLSSSHANDRLHGEKSNGFKFAKGWHEQADIARSYLDKAAKKMKKWADKKRRHTEYKVGDMVLVKLLPQQFKSLRPVHKSLVRRYEGLFPILGKVGKVSCKVKLPPRLKIHPVFHVSYLKPYHEDKDDPSRGFSKRAPTAVVTSYDKKVEHIIADRIIRRRGVPPATEYLVKWKRLPESEASWEPANALWQFQEQIERFRAEDATRTSAA